MKRTENKNKRKLCSLEQLPRQELEQPQQMPQELELQQKLQQQQQRGGEQKKDAVSTSSRCLLVPLHSDAHA